MVFIEWQESSLDEQLRNLGISAAELIGEKVLSIGCGRSAPVVRYLRHEGIAAYGVDPRADSDVPHILPVAVRSVAPSQGCLPYEDRAFDVVLMHSLPPVYKAFTRVGRMLPTMWQSDSLSMEAHGDEASFQQGLFMILEGARVLRDSGSMTVYPALDLLEERAGGMLAADGLESGMVPIECKDDTLRYLWDEMQEAGLVAQDATNIFVNRTLIYLKA
ncbi:MAG: hypothetical protein ACOCWQ_03450 [Nanoarchaeota archaeon]